MKITCPYFNGKPPRSAQMRLCYNQTMLAVPHLPAGFKSAGRLDMKKNWALQIGLNVLGLVLIALTQIVCLALIRWLRPQAGAQMFVVDNVLVFTAVLIGLLAVMVVVHELIHGVFFYLFSREKPHFGFRGSYAFASAPNWYFARRAYTLVALAPVVLLSLPGLAALLLGPGAWLLGASLYLSINVGSSVGDLAVVAWMYFLRRDVYARDEGDAVTLFVQTLGKR